jgi:hypothetical protein
VGASAVHKAQSLLGLHNPASNHGPPRRRGDESANSQSSPADRRHLHGFFARQPVERLSKWAKTINLNAIAKGTWRRPKSILAAPMACLPPCRSRTSGPGQWLVVALTEGSARLTVGQRLLSQGGFDAVATNSGDLFAIPGLLNKPIAASLMRNVDMIGRQPVLMALDHHRVGTLDMPRI